MQTHASEANETNAAHPVPAWREAPHTDLTRFNSVSLTAIKSTRLDEILKTPTWNTHVEINIITLQQQKWSSSWKHLNKNILSWCNNKLYNKLCVCGRGGWRWGVMLTCLSSFCTGVSPVSPSTRNVLFHTVNDTITCDTAGPRTVSPHLILLSFTLTPSFGKVGPDYQLLHHRSRIE